MDLANITAIKNLILPVLESHHVDFIDMELKGRSGSLVLRVFVDTEGGITLDQCAKLSREIADLLDTRDLIVGRYHLEVSSPGLDRPLTAARDFWRNAGRQVRIKYLTEQAEEDTIIGTIEQVDDNQVVVIQDNQQIKIDLSKILVAKIVPVW